MLQCDFCDGNVSECAKIPCAFEIHFEKKEVFLVVPKDETGYRNICLDCLFEQSKEQDE